MSLPVTVVTVAFGSPEVVGLWAKTWSETGAACLIANNGGALPAAIDRYASVLPSPGNIGFGAGINRAVQNSDTPVILVTNPDTLPENNNSLKLLYEGHNAGSITGATTLDPSGHEVHSTGIWPCRHWVRKQITGRAGSLWRKDSFDWLQGSLMMVHRDDFLGIGGFSSRFPLYFEDVDVCFRAKEHGMAVDFFNKSRFIHDEGSGSARVSATRLSCYHWGLLEYFRNHRPSDSETVRKMIVAKCILRMSVFAVADKQSFLGYYRALKSVLSGIPPALPGALNG